MVMKDKPLGEEQVAAMLEEEMSDKMRVTVGFTDFAELLNGRAAMVGFFAALMIEVFSGRGLLSIVSDLMG